MGFVFYDTETTGTDTSFDQILQFAAVRTDHELNEIERFDIRCRLLPHVVPTPEALRITALPLARLVDPALPSHYAMMRAIQAKLASWSPSLFVGFNSVQYDEHLLRQALFKTLHPPFLTNTNGNSRTDAMRIAQAAALLAPGTLIVPVDPLGRTTFALARLAAANGYAMHGPHDAMQDVQATLHLSRLIAERAPMLWSGFMHYAQKAAVLDHLREEPIVCISDFYSGKAYSWLVTLIGAAPTNPSELIVFDLQIDPDDVASLDDEALAERLQQQPKPLKRVKANACPIISPIDEAPNNNAAKWLGEDELARRVGRLKSDASLRQRLIVAFDSIRTVREPSPYVEQQIYDTFIPSADLPLLDLFHASPWSERPGIVDKLVDPRLRAIGEELIFIEQPDVLSEQRRAHFMRTRARRMLGLDGNVPWVTLTRAIGDLDAFLSDCEGHERPFLAEHRDHLVRLMGDADELAA